MLGGLSYLFYPWGFLLQIAALVHAIRRRPDGYWIWIILFGGFIGAAAYIVVEVVPDTRLLGDVFKGLQRQSRIKQLETAVIDNPSPGNYEELADLLLDQKMYGRARECYDKAITARADSIDPFYRRAICSLELKDIPRAIEDLEPVVHKDSRYDHDRAAGLLAHAYGLNGQAEQADALFKQATQISNLLETHYNYACFLKAQERRDEARAAAQWMLDRKRTLPGYLKRLERPWFRKASGLLKDLRQK